MVSHGNSMQHSTRSSMCFVFSRQPAALPALRHGGKRFRNAASRWEKKPRLDLQGFAMQVKAYGDLWGSWTINAISFRMAKTWSTRQGGLELAWTHIIHHPTIPGVYKTRKEELTWTLPLLGGQTKKLEKMWSVWRTVLFLWGMRSRGPPLNPLGIILDNSGGCEVGC